MGNINEKNAAGGSGRSAKSNFGKKGWMLVIISILCYTVYFVFDNGLNYIVPTFAEQYGWSQSTMYLFTTIGGWAGIVGMIGFGILLKKKGTKFTMVLALALFVISAGIWALATNLVMYGIGAIVTKASAIGFCYLCVAELASNWFPTKKGMFMGWATLGVTFGAILASSVLQGALISAGILVGIGIFAVVSLITLILVIIFVKDNPEEAGAYPDNNKEMASEDAKAKLAYIKKCQEESPWTVKKAIKTGNVWLIAISFGLLFCIAQAAMSQIVPACVSFGISVSTAQIFMLIASVVSLVMSIIGGVIDQKLGTKKATIISVIFVFLGCLCVGLLNKVPALVIVGLMVLMAAMAIANNMIMSLSGTIWGRLDFTGPFMVIIVVSQAISSGGYVLMSGLADITGGYMIPYIVFAGFALIDFFLFLKVNDKYQGRTEEFTN